MKIAKAEYLSPKSTVSKKINRVYHRKSKVERFLSKIQKDDETGCHNWTAYLDPHGYGRFAWEIFIGGAKMEVTSRAAWRLFVGEIPDGQFVCHKCDNPRCCNIDHLFLGEPKENSMDMARKWRTRSNLTPEQVAQIKNGPRSDSRGLAKKHGLKSHKSILNIWHGKTFTEGVI